jgi:hypothetical protein
LLLPEENREREGRGQVKMEEERRKEFEKLHKLSGPRG